MPVDWEDHQARPEPHASELLTDTSVTAPQTPSTLDVSGTTMKAYRSIRVIVTASGSDVDVTAYWELEGSASGQQPFETQRATDGTTTSMLFQSQGHELVQVSFEGVTADATIDYDIVGSNLDPLAASEEAGSFQYPTLYDVPLFTWATGEDSLRWQTVTQDGTLLNGGKRGVDNAALAGSYFVTHLRLGPLGSIWSISTRHNTLANGGKMFFYWATPTEDDPSAGLGAGTGLMEASNALTYVPYNLASVAGSVEGFSGAPAKNVLTTSRSEFRIMGEDGATVTAFTAGGAPLFITTTDGGAGLWNLKLLVNQGAGGAGKFNFELVELRVQRVDSAGF